MSNKIDNKNVLNHANLISTVFNYEITEFEDFLFFFLLALLILSFL